MTASTLPAVKAQLVSILGQLATDVPAYWTWPGVEQVWADMGGSHFERVEACWLDHVTPATVVHPTMRAGQKRREEEYDQIVNIGVQDAREDATLQAVEERALALFGAFEDAVAATGRLTGTTLSAGQQIVLARIDEWTLESGPLENHGYAAVVAANVLVRARLL